MKISLWFRGLAVVMALFNLVGLALLNLIFGNHFLGFPVLLLSFGVLSGLGVFAGSRVFVFFMPFYSGSAVCFYGQDLYRSFDGVDLGLAIFHLILLGFSVLTIMENREKI